MIDNNAWSFKRINTLLCTLLFSFNTFAQVYIEPSFELTSEPRFHIHSIETKDDSTILTFFYEAEAKSWANLSPHARIVLSTGENVPLCNGESYSINRCEGLPFAPDKRHFDYAQKIEVKCYFPSFPKSPQFDFNETSSGDGFGISGITFNSNKEREFDFYKTNRLQNQFEFYNECENTKKAIEIGQEIVSLLEATYGSWSIELMRHLFDLGKLYCQEGKYEESAEAINNSLDIYNSLLSTFVFETSVEDRLESYQNHSNVIEDIFPSVVAYSNDDNQIGNLYDKILFTHSIIYGNNTNFRWKDIQERLGDADIAIELVSPSMYFVNGKHSCYAILLKKDYTHPKIIKLFDYEEFRNEFEHSLSLSIKDIYKKNLWRPLCKELKGVRNVYITPVGFLKQLPFEHFIDGDDQFKNVDIYRLSSTSQLCKQKGGGIHNAVIFGDFDYYEKIPNILNNNSKDRRGFDPLPNVILEIHNVDSILIKNNINTAIFSKTTGTEKLFREFDSQNIDLFHIATHGNYYREEEIKQLKNRYAFLKEITDEEILKMNEILTHSFLVFSGANHTLLKDTILDANNDGIITALDIANMNFKDTELVVLSSCDSGLGEFVTSIFNSSLGEAFKIAGAKTIVISLDKVDDEATKILMVEFYKNLMNGKTKHQSLKDAQKYLREYDNGKFSDFKYWASFIMIDGLN